MPVDLIVRAAVLTRARGLCECCGLPLRGRCDVHHRRPGGKGGTARPDQHLASNLLALLPEHHNLTPTSVHMTAAASRETGLLVSTHHNAPAAVPVLLHGRRWVLLTAEGTYLDV